MKNDQQADPQDQQGKQPGQTIQPERQRQPGLRQPWQTTFSPELHPKRFGGYRGRSMSWPLCPFIVAGGEITPAAISGNNSCLSAATGHIMVPSLTSAGDRSSINGSTGTSRR